MNWPKSSEVRHVLHFVLDWRRVDVFSTFYKSCSYHTDFSEHIDGSPVLRKYSAESKILCNTDKRRNQILRALCGSFRKFVLRTKKVFLGCHLKPDFIGLSWRNFVRKMATVSVLRACTHLASGCSRREGDWLGANFPAAKPYTCISKLYSCNRRILLSSAQSYVINIAPLNFVRVRRCGCSSSVEPKKVWWHIPRKKKNTHSVKILVFLELVSAIFVLIGPVHCRSSGRMRLRCVPIWNSKWIRFSKF